MGLPHCRASQLYTTWPPACTAFRVSYSLFYRRASRSVGFPCTHNMASCIDRLPGVYRSQWWASRIVGLPSCIQYGLRHTLASVCLTVCLIARPPALSGFPCTQHKASGIDWLPCEPSERCSVGTCRYSLPEISTRRLCFTASQEGPLLGSTLHPPKYVPQLWVDIVWGVCFGSENGTEIGVQPWVGPRQGL